MTNEKFLDKLGIKDALHRRLVIETIPCGEENVEDAWLDKTPVQINAPRAIVICHWKGMVLGFQMIEQERAKVTV